MPRTKFTDHVNKQLAEDRQAKRDRIRETIRGAYRDQGYPIEAMCQALGVKQNAIYNRLNQPGDRWRLRDLIAVADCLGIPMSELTPYMSSEYYKRPA